MKEHCPSCHQQTVSTQETDDCLCWKIENNVEASPEALRQMQFALKLASKAKENSAARLSRFKVGSTIICHNGETFPGTNFEYGGGFGLAENRSLHSEESAIASMITQSGPNSKIAIMAVVGDTETPITPCGNCLDVIKSVSDENTIIVGGCASGKAIIWKIENLMPSTFAEIEIASLSKSEKDLLDAALQSAQLANTIFSEPVLGITGAALLTQKGSIFTGSHEDSAAWLSTGAVESALSHSRLHADPFVKAILIVTATGYINGKDRQKIFERANEIDAEDSLNVYIYNESKRTLALATPRQLLPYGFGPRSLGPTILGKIRENLKKYC